MTKNKFYETAARYAHDELKDNHAPIKVIVAAAFLNGIDYAEHHPHWISVEDELPPREKDVLIWSSGWNKAMIGYYKNWNWQRKTNVFHSYVDNGTWFNITHWMPIPQPPVVSNVERTGKKGGEE